MVARKKILLVFLLVALIFAVLKLGQFASSAL